MRILCVHAHFDDFEFVAAGTFEVWRRQRSDEHLRARVLVCTDGKAGHHFRTRDETGLLRMREQEASAAIGRFEYESLRLPDGSIPREACLQVSIPLLASLWRSIRAFEPDYLFCPPIPAGPLAGIHNDHVTIADAIRRVAYMINVPHAFTPEFPTDESAPPRPVKVPVILNCYDSYMFGAGATHDIAIDVEEAFDTIAAESFCHRSQIQEWLPWVGRHDMPAAANLDEWKRVLRARFDRQNRELGIRSDHAIEVFTVTAWGEVPTIDQLTRDFPGIVRSASNLQQLDARLKQWRPQ